MRVAYFDCFSGISGDMCLGALLSAGVDEGAFLSGLRSLPLEGWELAVEPVLKGSLRAFKVRVEVGEHQPARHLYEIEEIITAGDLPEPVKRKACAVFWKLAEAEGGIHGEPPTSVHFHEVGAVDAIIDVVGTVWGLHLLGVERVFASPLPLGRGFVVCHHGVLPVPAPATLKLLEGVPVYGSAAEGELVTPTGAALITTLAEKFDGYPLMRVARVGYGAGTKDLSWPNVLRLVVGELLEF